LNPNVVVRCGTSKEQIITGAFSLDCGKSWKAFPKMPIESKGYGPMAVSADGKTIVWSLKKRETYVTADFGNTWTACKGLPGPLRIVSDTINSDTFYALDAPNGTLYASHDEGKTFKLINTDLQKASDYGGGFGGDGGPGATLHSVPGHEGDLWIASRSAGLFRSVAAGAGFSREGKVAEAYSIGFGKPLDGCKYPSIFLAGKIDDIIGLFRSDDSGASWVRINDDLHQFGWINHVTGDMRIYGRVYFGTGGRGIFYGDIAR
jgi:xyloglucan-specific exo-beta-1,4-glucanase